MEFLFLPYKGNFLKSRIAALNWHQLLPGWTLKVLTLDEKEEVQHFLNSVQDFFHLCEGKAILAEDILTSCPPSKNLEKDKRCLGLYKDKYMQGLIDLVQNFPQEGTWIIGYLIIHPQSRSQGQGGQFIQDLSLALKSLGVQKLRCIVQIQNPRALVFWQKNGFKITPALKNSNSRTSIYSLEKQL